MSLLFKVICSSACSSTHHWLAMDAIGLLKGPNADLWRNLFLRHYEAYLSGAKAPDNRFKDFKNHVLHVDEGFWGGAAAATRGWYDRTVVALRAQAWSDAAFAAGVLSHYYSDPLMPFHTAQSEEEGAVHRAAEWSIACAYQELRQIVEDAGMCPEVDIADGADWLEQMVRRGAVSSQRHYHVVIGHYNLAKGVKDPPAGLDQEIKDRIAQCLGEATRGLARILERAFQEAAVVPPAVSLSLETFLAALKIPVRWVTKKMADAKERALIERIYAEVRQTGKVIANLPEDDKLVRLLHAEEVLKVPLADLDGQAARPTGQQYGTAAPKQPASGQRRLAPIQPLPVASTTTAGGKPMKSATSRVSAGEPAMPASPPPPVDQPIRAISAPSTISGRGQPSTPARALRFYLDLQSPVEDAPSIGPKTAERFHAIGVRTVGELLAAEASTTAKRLGVRWLDAATIRDIQAQASLVCRVPKLRGHDAQMLVACGVTEPESLADMNPAALLARVEPFLDTTAGQRILRSSPKPDLAEVTDWITWAAQARTLKAA